MKLRKAEWDNLPTLKGTYADYPQPAQKIVEHLIAEFPEIATLPIVSLDSFPGAEVVKNSFEFDKLMMESEDMVASPVDVQLAAYAMALRQDCINKFGDPEGWTRIAQFKALTAHSLEDPTEPVIRYVFEWGFKILSDVKKED